MPATPPPPDPAGIPPASPARTRLRLAAIALVLGAGALLRLLLVPALPRLFMPGDPATFLAMARGVLATGVPRVDFIWNFTALPHAIAHVESFYEPAYAYLLAALMWVFGPSPASGIGLSLVCGILAIALTYRFARRFGPRVATVAAAIVAFEPWSIYYSGVLMKESLVALVVVLALEALRRLAARPHDAWRTGLAAAAVVAGAALFEYELLPALGIAAVVVLAVERRGALAAYLAALACAIAGFGMLGAALGVPISAKFALMAGARMWTTAARGAGTYASPAGLERALPFVYVLGSVLVKWYVPLLVMAWIGSRARDLRRVDLLLPATFAVVFLWVHGIPHDLSEQDFIPLLPVFAPFAALAICRSALWAARLGRSGPRLPRMSRGVVAVALIGGTIVGVMAIYRLHIEGILPVRWIRWTALAATGVLACMFGFVTWRIGLLLRLRPLRRAIPVLGMGVLLAAFSQSLPWTWIYRNPMFPGYDADSAAHAHAARMLDAVEPSAPVMASRPAEVALDSGHPAVLLPKPASAAVIDELRQRYHVHYLFVYDHDFTSENTRPIRLRRVAGCYGYTLYAFGADAVAEAPTHGVPAAAAAAH